MLGVLGGSIGACSGIATIMLSLVNWQVILSRFVVLGVRAGASPVCVFGVPGVGGIPRAPPTACAARVSAGRGSQISGET